MTIDQTLRRDLLKSTAPSHSSSTSGGNPPSRGLDLDQHLVSSSKQVLLKKIDFQPAERDVSFQLQNLRVKYVPLNPAKKASSAEEESTMKSNKQSKCRKLHIDWMHRPVVIWTKYFFFNIFF